MTGTADLNVDTGAALNKTLTVRDPATQNPINIDGWEVKAWVKESVDASTTILQFEPSNGNMQVDGPNGKIQFQLTGQETAALTPGGYVYDLLLDPPNDYNSYFLLEGSFTVTKRITDNDPNLP